MKQILSLLILALAVDAGAQTTEPCTLGLSVTLASSSLPAQVPCTFVLPTGVITQPTAGGMLYRDGVAVTNITAPSFTWGTPAVYVNNQEYDLLYLSSGGFAPHAVTPGAASAPAATPSAWTTIPVTVPVSTAKIAAGFNQPMKFAISAGVTVHAMLVTPAPGAMNWDAVQAFEPIVRVTVAPTATAAGVGYVYLKNNSFQAYAVTAATLVNVVYQ